MQPLTLVVPGEYWDSQIYSGRLYLFGLNGDIQTINWDSLVRSRARDSHTRLAVLCAFLRSDYLYGIDLQDILRDRDIRRLVKSKFTALEGTPINVSRRVLSRHTLGHQDNPCPFPHSDSEIYYRNLYVGSSSGVVRATASGRTKYPISTRPERLWDAPVVALAGGWGSLALAAGEEGLYELGVLGWRREPQAVAPKATYDCNWMFHSLFSSSHTGGFLARFDKYHQANDREMVDRVFRELIDIEQLLPNSGYSWGVQDKICGALPEGIGVVRYLPWAGERDQQFSYLGTVETEPWKGAVLSASVAAFGVVVELDNAIVVFPSAGRAVTIRGEPVNWRVFPRSKHYENQLHLIYEDRLEILSFNQDYLVDQEEKRLGTSVFYTRGPSVRPLLLDV